MAHCTLLSLSTWVGSIGRGHTAACDLSCASLFRSRPPIKSLVAQNAGVDRISEPRDHWRILWDATRAVAEAYGLSPDKISHTS